MKKFLVLIISVLLIASCDTLSSHWIQNGTMPIYQLTSNSSDNYEILGNIKVSGDIDKLVKEAQKKYPEADAIINIIMEVNTKERKGLLSKLTLGNNRTRGTVIKYVG